MARIDQLPNLFLLGVQKAGTTMLYDLFKDHPSIFLPENKEPHYFSCNAYYEKGIDYYRQYYQHVKDQEYIGDFTPDYLFWPQALKRMTPFITEQTRFIVSLRQPAVRAYSQYNMMVSRGFYMGGFEHDINQEVINTTNPAQKNLLRPSHMIARGMYSMQLKRLFNLVKKNQVKIIVFEEWVKNKEETIKEVESFLKIPHFEAKLNKQTVSNSTLIYPSNSLVKRLKEINNLLLKSSFSKNKYLLKVKEKFKQKVGKRPEKLDGKKIEEITKKFFWEDIQECEKLLGRDLSIWY